MTMAQSMKPDRKDWNPKNWATSFLERHKDRLSFGKAKGLGFERVSPLTMDHVEVFAKWFGPWIIDKRVSATTLINADETRVTVDREVTSGKTIGIAGKRKKAAIVASSGKAATYLPFHSAAGIIIMDVFVIPTDNDDMAEFHINEVALGARKKHPTYFGFTETGWMNSETWRVIIRKFHQEMCQQYPGMEPILLLDQLKIHLDDESLRFCVANKIHVGFFPAHCTHFLQPSDDTAFSTFKKGLAK